MWDVTWQRYTFFANPFTVRFGPCSVIFAITQLDTLQRLDMETEVYFYWLMTSKRGPGAVDIRTAVNAILCGIVINPLLNDIRLRSMLQFAR